MIDHFADYLGIQLTPAFNNPYWHFGYFYTASSTKWCANYGSNNDGSGVRVGESNSKSTRRFVCPCTGTTK